MKIGVLGTGKITDKVIPMLVQLEEIECYAAASRTLEKAEAFCEKYGFQKAYGSYEELLSDPAVELVYVATPHSHHYPYMMMCLEHGKPVICEKPFTINADLARRIKETSQAKGIYAAEAMWTRYMPSRKIIRDLIDSGIIGEVRTLTANLFYHTEERERIRNIALAGGALLDVGIYGINFALMSFGTEIEKIESSVQMTETGVDGMNNVTIFFKDGRTAIVTSGICSRSDRQGVFYGTKGYMIVQNINNPQSVAVYDSDDNLLKKVTVPEQINGYEYEFLEAVRCIGEGKTQSDSMPLDETIRVLDIMDGIRAQWGFRYPQEEESV